jgi:hypothetical protein
MRAGRARRPLTISCPVAGCSYETDADNTSGLKGHIAAKHFGRGQCNVCGVSVTSVAEFTDQQHLDEQGRCRQAAERRRAAATSVFGRVDQGLSSEALGTDSVVGDQQPLNVEWAAEEGIRVWDDFPPPASPLATSVPIAFVPEDHYPASPIHPLFVEMSDELLDLLVARPAGGGQAFFERVVSFEELKPEFLARRLRPAITQARGSNTVLSSLVNDVLLSEGGASASLLSRMFTWLDHKLRPV